MLEALNRIYFLDALLQIVSSSYFSVRLKESNYIALKVHSQKCGIHDKFGVMGNAANVVRYGGKNVKEILSRENYVHLVKHTTCNVS